MANQDITEDLVRVARNEILKPLSKTSISVGRSVKNILPSGAFTQYKQAYPCGVALSMIDVYPKSAFCVITASWYNFVINLSNHQRVTTTRPPPSAIFVIEMTTSSRTQLRVPQSNLSTSYIITQHFMISNKWGNKKLLSKLVTTALKKRRGTK